MQIEKTATFRAQGKRVMALALGLLLLAAPLYSLATDRSVEYVAVTGDDAQYSERPSISVPGGGFPENEWIQGTNPNTGLPWEGDYRPILVNIDTHPDARPNWGVYSADVIYEMPLQADGSTRSVALFIGDVPTSGAGPVRSARVPMIDLREEWQALYTFYGTQEMKGTSVREYVRELYPQNWDVNTFSAPFFDGMAQRIETAYCQRVGGYPNPHNVRWNITQTIADNLQNQPKMRPWKFSEEGLNRGASAYAIRMDLKPDYVPEFLYNDQTRSYDRYYNYEPFVDGNNGVQCTYSNVIIMRTDVSWFRNGPNRPVIKMTGQGPAEIFMNGRYIRGSWVRSMGSGDARADLAARTVFLDENGQEISFLPGKTFVHIVSMSQEVIIGNNPAEGDVIRNAKPVPTPKPTKEPKATKPPRPTRTPKAGAEATPAPEAPVDNGGEEDGEVELPGD